MFSKVLPLHIADFPVFVFSGLVAWSWFASGVTAGTSSVVANRHLVFQSRFPVGVLPLVAVAVPLIDVLMALPVLLIMLAIAGDIHVTILFLPVILIVQFILMAGIAWFAAASQVYLRDVSNIVGLLVLITFYVTPVFYDRASVSQYGWLLQLNPMTTVIESWRAVMLDGVLPLRLAFGILIAVSIVTAGLGYLAFRSLQPGFVDEL